MDKNMIKIWVDDVRMAPSEDWLHMYTVEGTIRLLERLRELGIVIEVMSLDHDAGDYAMYGGDYIKILDWMEKYGYACPMHFHTANPVGMQNMKRICERNGWPIFKRICI